MLMYSLFYSHKLSLYLAVGLPVIIWEKAAEAEFVLKENVGVTVKSLYELPQRLATEVIMITIL